jgi:hypothetical protein
MLPGIHRDSRRPRRKRHARGVFFAVVWVLVRCADFASCYLDERGDNSSIAPAPSCLPWRIRENSCGFR